MKIYKHLQKVRPMKSLIRLFQMLAFITAYNLTLFAQDGEKLFKSRCASCHMIDKNSTGPALKGVKAKWESAGEGEMLYEWVTNPTNLLASGKSQSAKAIEGFSPTIMSPQAVTNEEIDAIFKHIDTYVPPIAPANVGGEPSNSQGDKKVMKVKPDYHKNLTYFYFLLFGIFIQVIGVFTLSGSVGRLVRSDFFKNKLSTLSSKVTSLILIISASILIPNNLLAFGLQKAGEGDPKDPWLLIENVDLYALATINIILLLVILYLRRLFYSMMEMAMPKTNQFDEVPVVNFKKINAILTDSVIIEEEHTILMHHEYDGIRELDNNLPPWWVWGFVATVVFAFIYMINYHILGTSDLQLEAYEKDKARAKVEVDAYLKKMALDVDETNVTELKEADALAAGKNIYSENCVSCHLDKGQGQTGPNLTDKNWIYGFDIKDIFKSIKLGRPNGMPEHASKLNPVQIQQVASFVISFPEAKGKDPEGKILEK